MPATPVDPTVDVLGLPRRSGRISTQLLISYKKQHGHHVQYASSEIPDENLTTHQQAVNSLLKEEWIYGIKDEIIELKKNKSFYIVSKPIGWKIVGTKWVFKTQKNADGTLEREQKLLRKDFLKLLALTSKTPLPRLFSMNHSNYCF